MMKSIPKDDASSVPLLHLSASDIGISSDDEDGENELFISSKKSGQSVKLHQTLGIRNGVSIIVGIIIGSGIFVSPKGIVHHCGSVGLSLLVWLLCGVYALCGALCYAELGTTIPSSGGCYIYILKMFGDLPAFVLLWATFLVRMPTGTCVGALIFSKYALEDIFSCVSPPESALRIVAFLVINMAFFINSFSMKWLKIITDISTLSKVFALFVIIISGLVMLCMGHTENFQRPFEGTNTDVSRIALGFYAGIYSYAGWDTLNTVTEELKDPHRTLPLSIGISVSIVTVIYVLTNVAYFTVLTSTEILLSPAVAVTFAGKILNFMSWCVPLFVALSCFGSLSAGMLSASRLLFAGARSGHLPMLVGMVNVRVFTPIPSLLVMTFMSCCMLLAGDLFELINYLEFVEAIILGLPVCGLIYYRWKEPDWNRPLKVWLIIPVIFILCTLFLVLLPLYSNPLHSVIGLLIVFSGVPVYLTMTYKKKSDKTYNFEKYFDKITCIIQKILYVIPEECNKTDELSQ